MASKAEIVKQLIAAAGVSPELVGEMKVGTLWNRAYKTKAVPPRWIIRDIEAMTVADVLREA